MGVGSRSNPDCPLVVGFEFCRSLFLSQVQGWVESQVPSHVQNSESRSSSGVEVRYPVLCLGLGLRVSSRVRAGSRPVSNCSQESRTRIRVGSISKVGTQDSWLIPYCEVEKELWEIFSLLFEG